MTGSKTGVKCVNHPGLMTEFATLLKVGVPQLHLSPGTQCPTLQVHGANFIISRPFMALLTRETVPPLIASAQACLLPTLRVSMRGATRIHAQRPSSIGVIGVDRRLQHHGLFGPDPLGLGRSMVSLVCGRAEIHDRYHGHTRQRDLLSRGFSLASTPRVPLRFDESIRQSCFGLGGIEPETISDGAKGSQTA